LAAMRVPLLSWANEYGSTRCVKYLLKRGGTALAGAQCQHSGTTPLHWVALAPVSKLRHLLHIYSKPQYKPYWDLKDNAGLTARDWLILRIHEHPELQHETTLALTAGELDMALVDKIIQHGGNVMICPRLVVERMKHCEKSAMHPNLMSWGLEVPVEHFEQILRLGGFTHFRPDMVLPGLENTPLHTMARFGRMDLFAYFEANYDNVAFDTPDQNGHTPLYRAVEYGNVDVALALLDKGADPKGAKELAERMHRCCTKLQDRQQSQFYLCMLQHLKDREEGRG